MINISKSGDSRQVHQWETINKTIRNINPIAIKITTRPIKFLKYALSFSNRWISIRASICF